jgi:glutamyl-tRNA reductase
MDCRNKILEFMRSNIDGKRDFVNWVQTFPKMQQVELMREMNRMAEEMAAEQGLKITDHLPNFDKADSNLDTLEDAILNERLLRDYVEYFNDLKHNLKNKILNDIEQQRMYIISNILNDAPNAPDMRELAKKMIAAEKKFDTYKPENWQGIDL